MATYSERKLLEWQSIAFDKKEACTVPATLATQSIPPHVSSAPQSAPLFDGPTSSKWPIVKLPASQPTTKSDMNLSSSKQVKRKREDDATPSRVVRRKIKEAPRCSGGDATKILVGSDEEVFLIHNNLLAAFSQLLKSSRDDNHEDHTIKLSECHAEVFQVFYHFLYSGLIFSSKDDDLESTPSSGEYPADSEWTRLCEAWILADKIQSAAFKDACTDAFIAKINETNTSPTDAYTAIYPHGDGSGRCGMKRLCVDLVVWSWNETTMANCKGDRSNFGEFWFDVAMALNEVKHREQSGSAPYANQGTCHYHDHGKGPCYKTMF